MDQSNLAEAVTQVTLERVWEKLNDDGKLLTGATDASARFCVLAFGKLGGAELNYSSDIDLLGIYDDRGMFRQAGDGQSSYEEIFMRAMEQLPGLAPEQIAAAVKPVDWKAYQRNFGRIDLAKVIREALRYDIVVDEGPDVATEAERLFDILPQLLGVLKDIGFPVELVPDLTIGTLKNVGLLTSEQAEEALRRAEAMIQAQAQQQPQPQAAPQEGAGNVG